MILEYDLQFFAAEGMGGEKTEPATEKKLSDARKEGQVAKSREIANGFGLLTVFLVLKIWVGHMGYQFINVFSVIYERIPEVVTFWHGNMPQQDTAVAFRQMLLQAIIIMAPLLLLGLVVAFLSDVVQVGWKPTSKPLHPKFSKLNPLSGFKRIFSVNALVELIKSILKIGLITYICYNYLKDKWPLLDSETLKEERITQEEGGIYVSKFTLNEPGHKVFEAGYEEGLPAFYQVEFNVDEPADTFLDMTGWGKGFVVVNAFNLGRFWEEGPQRRLYLPGALLKPGKNELLIFETEGKHKATVILCDTPDLGDE